jgi:polyisoprenoid-binding protein YceI
MKLSISLFAVAGLSTVSFAQSKTFDFGRPNLAPNQVITVESNTAFEDFVGRTTKVSGNLTVDITKKTGSGKLIVDLASLNTGIDLRDEHMRSEGWLNVAKFPNATFETTSIKSKGGDKFELEGNFTLHGVTKKLKTMATAKYIAESEVTKRNRFAGDVMQVKTKFNIKLSDYGIKIPAGAADKVSNNLIIGVSVIGTTK